MRILILGGTEFVGRALVDEALAQGAEVTVLNRGTHPAPPGVEAIVADRRRPGRLTALTERASAEGPWDTVVDTWSWEPWAVRESARVLEPLAARYVLVSSRSVYADPLPAGADEGAPVVEASADDGDPDARRRRADALAPADPALDYARSKAGAELAAREAFGERAVLLRAGLVLGPRENIGRLPWWLGRLARGGEVLAPGRPEGTFQYVDARDLAAWAVRDAGALSGAYNVVTPPGAHTLGELLELCRRVTAETAEGAGRPPAHLRWVAEEQLLEAGVAPWIELPVWLPAGPDHEAMHEGDVSRAGAAGLTYRPLAATVTDTWRWLESIGGAAPQRTDRPVLGLPAEREAAILAR